MEFLKPILGDQLYLAVQQKLAGRTDVKLANLAQGGYVAKEKFAASLAKVATLEKNVADLTQKLTEANQKLTAVASTTQKTAQLEAQVVKLTQEKQQITAQYEQKLMAQKVETALNGALIAARPKNMKAVRALIDMSKIKVADGKITGLQEQIAAIKQSDPYLFEATGNTGRGSNPPPSSDKIMRFNPDRLDDNSFYNIKFKR